MNISVHICFTLSTGSAYAMDVDIYIYICIGICIYIYVYVHVCACVYLYVCMYVCMCMTMYMYICISAESLHAFTGVVAHYNKVQARDDSVQQDIIHRVPRSHSSITRTRASTEHDPTQTESELKTGTCPISFY